MTIYDVASNPRGSVDGLRLQLIGEPILYI